MEPQKHLLPLTIQHIVSDGWSMGVLHQELFTLYEAFVQGQPSPLLSCLSNMQILRSGSANTFRVIFWQNSLTIGVNN